MTITEVMDLQCAQESEGIERQLCEINKKLDYVVTVMDQLEHRVEGLEEIREDLWPMVNGASHALSRKLHELDQNGALGFAREAVRVGERIATSFDEEDVRLLGENVVGILKTVRNLTQPEVLGVADRAAVALRESDGHPERKLTLWKAMRDPEVRKGMTLMLTVLREMGHEGSAPSAAAPVADESAKERP